MLAGVLTLHNPNCRGACAPNDCVQDLEAFCGSIRAAHFGVGVKRSNGSIDGQLTLSSADADDVLAYLLSRAWELSKRFRPGDDGRGSCSRLGGFLAQRLHFAATDWTRRRFGATRYGPVPTFSPAAHPEVHITETWVDPELDDSDALDLDAAPPGTAQALSLLQPLLDGEVESAKELARRTQVEPGQIDQALHLVRVAARQQGLEPGDEQRHTLADQAAELRKQRLTYRQIASELSLHSTHTAAALIRDYHPDLIKPSHSRPRLSANGHQPHRESLCDAAV
jgi:hypothetical protein